MKKTLTLLALLGAMAVAPMNAEVIWWPGVEATPSPIGGYELHGATATYKHNSGGTNPGDIPDYNMCWGVSAANQLSWWQTQVEKNGALIIPKEAPRGNDVWEKMRQMWKNQGYWVPMGIQHWLHGSENCGYIGTAEKSKVMTEQGMSFGGYFPRVAQANFFRESYIDTANGYHNDKALINVLRFSGNSEETSYSGISAQVKEMLQDGWSFTFSTASTASNHAMTVFGFDFDETTGLIDKFYYSDNNDMGISKDKAFALETYNGGTSSKGYSLMYARGYGKIEYLYAMRSTGIIFTDYDVKVGTNLVDQNQDVFSHYCNLIVDGADNFKLQYDLRDANVEGSPVTPYIVTYLDEFKTEEVTNQKATTGDMRLRGGKVTLVNCEAGREELDGGGSVEGTIFFEESAVQGTNRTLVVDRTDTIAGEINLGASSGANILDVTQGNTASFGTLSGSGDLDKTGAGTAEVTGALTLQGDIRVHEGSFVFGKDATISGAVSLTVSGGGVLKGSGTFASVTVDDGGTLIVGNSPGRQTYTGDLSVNLGEIVFGVSGWETAADEDNVGWGSGTYSNVAMTNGSLTLGEGCQISFGVADGALAALLSGNGGSFSMTIATGIGNGDYFGSDLLRQLADQTIFYVADEAGAAIANNAGLNAGDTLNTRISDLRYELVDNTQLCITGVFWREAPLVPEPMTGTMTLLALASLAARRRKR